MIICTHFKIEELVPPDIIIQYGSSAWALLTDQIKQTADNIREYFGAPMHINTQTLHQRGYRTPGSAEYSPSSQHAIGNAIDFNIDGLSPEHIRSIILQNQNLPAFSLIGGVEDFPGMSWVHVDCRGRQNGNIVVFSNK